MNFSHKKILAILLLLTCSILAAEKDKLNVIVIMADALGYYGGEIKTQELMVGLQYKF